MNEHKYINTYIYIDINTYTCIFIHGIFSNIFHPFCILYLLRVARVAQSGMFVWFAKERFPRISGSTGDYRDDAAREIRIEKMVSSTIEMIQAPEPFIRLKNVHKLARIYFIFLPVALIVLWYEFVHDSIRKSKTQKATTALRATLVAQKPTPATQQAKEAPKRSRLITTK